MSDYTTEDTKSITDLEVVIRDGVILVDSRLVAKGLGLKHQTFMETIESYKKDLERRSPLIYDTEATNSKGRPESFYWLTKVQANFLVTLSRNTPTVVEFKWGLVDRIDRLETELLQIKQQVWEETRELMWQKSLKFKMLKKMSDESEIDLGEQLLEHEKLRQNTLREYGQDKAYLEAHPERDFDSPNFDWGKFLSSFF